jgi:hypothetical protein
MPSLIQNLPACHVYIVVVRNIKCTEVTSDAIILILVSRKVIQLDQDLFRTCMCAHIWNTNTKF